MVRWLRARGVKSGIGSGQRWNRVKIRLNVSDNKLRGYQNRISDLGDIKIELDELT